MSLSIIGKYHTILIQEVIGSPGCVVAVLYLELSNDSITMHTQFHEFMIARKGKSTTWKRTYARALGLFWDFLRAIESQAKNWNPINLHRLIYRQFCDALLFGTINPETKLDPTGLYWPGMGRSLAGESVNALENFITWVVSEAAETGTQLDVSTLAKLSSYRTDTFPTDSILATRFIIVAKEIKKLSMLSHLKDVREMAGNYQQQNAHKLYDFGPSNSSFDADPVHYMDPEIVATFLQHGFVRNESEEVPEDREDITDKMIYLLMTFGGMRVSEPFQLWFNDIILESDFTCKVILRHPAEAKTFILGEENITRKEYLARRGMLPRNLDQINTSYHAGWKNIATDKSLNAPVFWIHSGAEAEFSALYRRYLVYRRKLIDQRLLRGLPDHPFLFVSDGEDRCAGISHVGDPYSISAFSKTWNKALGRISKVLGREVIRSKNNGTSFHGSRHFYGQSLSDASADPKAIQKGLRHRSILSQAPYTSPDFARVSAALTDARKKIEDGNGLSINITFANGGWNNQLILQG